MIQPQTNSTTLPTHVLPTYLSYFLFKGINIVVSTIGLAISKSLYPFYFISIQMNALILDKHYGMSPYLWHIALLLWHVAAYYGKSPDLWHVACLFACRVTLMLCDLTYGMSTELWHVVWLVAYRLSCSISPDLWRVAWLMACRLIYGMSLDLWYVAWLVACRRTCGMSPDLWYVAWLLVQVAWNVFLHYLPLIAITWL